MSGKFEIKGLENVMREIQQVKDDKIKRKQVLALMRRQAAPVRTAIKNETPTADSVIIGRGGKEYPVGNLKKSIGIKTLKKGRKYGATHIGVAVGPRKGGKKKNDGFYGFFLQYGTAYTEPNDFIKRGSDKVMPQVATETTEQLKKYIIKKYNQ